MKYTKSDIEKYSAFSAGELNDAGICPTCFNRQCGGKIFGNDSERMVFEDKDIECVLITNPRADGHMIITTKKHFHDLAECPDRINRKIISYIKELMNIICEVYGCERVYLCTMSDGPMNHYHMQLIPRYTYEERGSKNFVKPRKEYFHDQVKLDLMRQKIKLFTERRKHKVYNKNKTVV